MRTIYSTEKISLAGITVLGLQKLTKTKREWVVETQKRLSAHPTLAEKVAARMLSRLMEKPVRQAFFMIRGRSYFLDFFFPSSMVAVEIDGSSHRFRKGTDRRRDADFRSVGIRTIRISNKDVLEGRLYEKLQNRLYLT